MKATFVLAVMVGVCFWSTLGRSSTFESMTMATTATAVQEPDECIDLAKIASRSIKRNHKLPNIKVQIGVNDLCDQIQNLDSKVDFLSSVTMAMESFLNDASDIESPLSLMIDLAFDDLGVPYTYPVPDTVRKHAQQMLIDHLNRKSSSITLLARDESPEGGESVDQNWILLLQIRDLSDHSFWSVVDRSGVEPVYNYGFN